MVYTIDGVVAIVGYDTDGKVVSLTFPFIANEAGQPQVITFTPGVAVDNINQWLAEAIKFLGY